MTSPLSATAQIDASYTPPLPDGLAVGSHRIFQAHTDAREFAANALAAHLLWSGEFGVVGSAPNNFTVTLGTIAEVVLYASSTYKPFSYAGGTINQSSIEGGGGTLGVAADVWYVYAYNNAGSIGFEISQTAPNAARTIKNGDSTRRYLGAFPTNGSGVPIALHAVRGRYVFRQAQSVLSGGTSTTAATVSLTNYVPTYATVATVELKLNRGTDASNRAAYLYGAASGSYVTMQLDATNLSAANYVVRGRADVELDASQNCAYSIDSSAGSASVDGFVCGWLE